MSKVLQNGLEHSAILSTCTERLSVSKTCFLVFFLSGRVKQVLLHFQKYFEGHGNLVWNFN